MIITSIARLFYQRDLDVFQLSTRLAKQHGSGFDVFPSGVPHAAGHILSGEVGQQLSANYLLELEKP